METLAETGSSSAGATHRRSLFVLISHLFLEKLYLLSLENAATRFSPPSLSE